MTARLLRSAPRWAIQLAGVAGAALVFSLVWGCVEMVSVVIR